MLPMPCATSLSPCTISMRLGIEPSVSARICSVAGLDALTHRLHRGEHPHTTVALDMQPHGFLVHESAGPLEEGRDRASPQPAARLVTRACARRNPPSRRLRARDRAGSESCRCRTSRPSRCDRASARVAPSCAGAVRRVDLELRGRAIHQPFDQVDRLGPARAAIRTDDVGVGQHRLRLQVERRHVIDTG